MITSLLAPLIRVFIFICYPVCYPIAKGLDHVLGHTDSTVRFQKRDLKAIMELHHYRKNPQFEGFNQEEVVIINSIIDLRSTLAQKVMIPLAKNYSLKED